MKKWAAQRSQGVQSWWLRRADSTRSLPRHLWTALRNFLIYGTDQAAALSYYTLLSIFPLTLLLAVAANSIVDPVVSQQQIANGLSLFLPNAESVVFLQGNVREALEQAGRFNIVAVIGLVWAALGLFSNLSGSLDRIFQVPSSRSLWRQRLLAFLMSVTLVVLVITSFITSGLLRLVGALLLDSPTIWINIGTVFLPFSLNLVIFILLFRYVPSRHVSWEAIWPAAIFGAAGWELGKAVFVWYLQTFANFTLVYGSIATVIVLLFWSYLIASIVLISAELCARLNDWIIERHAPVIPITPQGE